MADSVNINWTAITAVIAAVTAVILIWQVRFSQKIQTLLHLEKEWQSLRMLSVRRRAARALLKKEPNRDVDEILDFFETVSLFSRRCVLDQEITWHTFYWPLINYWCASESYIKEVNKNPSEKRAWEDLVKLVPWLIKQEDEPPPGQDQVKNFLETERDLTLDLKSQS